MKLWPILGMLWKAVFSVVLLIQLILIITGNGLEKLSLLDFSLTRHL